MEKMCPIPFHFLEYVAKKVTDVLFCHCLDEVAGKICSVGMGKAFGKAFTGSIWAVGIMFIFEYFKMIQVGVAVD